VICDHVSESTKCDNDMRSCLQRYNVEMRLSDEQELREITSAIDKPRVMLETIRETRGDAICIACVWYKSKQCDICTVILKVKIDRKLHVIHYGLMV
jgi:hypothetical protein